MKLLYTYCSSVGKSNVICFGVLLDGLKIVNSSTIRDIQAEIGFNFTITKDRG